MGHGLAEEDFTRLRRGQRPAASGQHFRKDPGHQWLGIDQYAVTVEQHGIEGKRDIYYSGTAKRATYASFSHSRAGTARWPQER